MTRPQDALPTGYGQVAFEAYKARAIETGEFGDPPPVWWGLGERQRDAWDIAAAAVLKYVSRLPS